jgi:hypothetical protein
VVFLSLLNMDRDRESGGKVELFAITQLKGVSIHILK